MNLFPLVEPRPGVPFGFFEGGQCDLIDSGQRYAVRLVYRESGWCLLAEDDSRYWPLIALWRWQALAHGKRIEGMVNEVQGQVYLVGTAAPVAETMIEQLMEDSRVLLIDIRYAARSRWFPWCNKNRLLARWSPRYTHERGLSNRHYKRPDLPVELVASERSIAGAVDLLRKGLSLCLLCACRGDNEACHCRSVIRLLAEQLAGPRPPTGAGSLGH
jgi:hypothetical protein